MALFADIGMRYVPGSPWWTGWNLDPVLLIGVLLAARVYTRGVLRLWRAGPNRGVANWQVACFAAGLCLLVLALTSPLDSLSGSLASAHMVQHMIVMNVAAPLLALGSPAVVMLNGVPRTYRRALGKLWRLCDPPGPTSTTRNPVATWLLYAAVLWVWHLPLLYDAALQHRAIHDLQHITFLIAAFLFWRAILDRSGRRLGPGLALIYLFTTSLHATVLGVVMTLAPTSWYSSYVGLTEPWGLTPLEDQQLAGLIMWMPACLAYAIAAAGILAAWLSNERGET